MSRNMAASVRQRLLNRARLEGRVFQEIATLYAMETAWYSSSRPPTRWIIHKFCIGSIKTNPMDWVYTEIKTKYAIINGGGQRSKSIGNARIRDSSGYE